MTNIDNENWDFTTNPTDFYKGYYKQLYADKFEILNEMDKLLEKHNLQNWHKQQQQK